jgi:outer membrane protein assembly factor BamB
MPVNGYGARKNKPNVSHDDAFRVIAVGDLCFFCSSAENAIVALDARSGEVRWSVFTNAAPRLAPAYWRGRLYVGADDGVFRCLNADDVVALFRAATFWLRLCGSGNPGRRQRSLRSRCLALGLR